MKIKSRFLFIGLLLLFNPSISNVKASIPDAKYSDYLILGKVRKHKETTASKDGYSWGSRSWTMTSVNTWGRYKLEKACNL